MKKKIYINEKYIYYISRKSTRAKSVRLSVFRDGSVSVTSPVYIPETSVERFIREKSKWLISKIAQFTESPIPTGSITHRGRKDYLKYKEEARRLVKGRLEHYNEIYKFKYKRVAIRDQKTRWGSCSTSGNLNFNYKIALLPSHLADYIIVHELCHLKEFNHSKCFWDLVSLEIPNHNKLRHELKKMTMKV